MTPTPTVRIISVAKALMSGVTPSLTLDQINRGKVVDPGPVVNALITTSSRLIVKASSQPDRIAGEITGRVTSNITCQGRLPRSIAASSIARSVWIILA